MRTVGLSAFLAALALCGAFSLALSCSGGEESSDGSLVITVTDTSPSSTEWEAGSVLYLSLLKDGRTVSTVSAPLKNAASGIFAGTFADIPKGAYSLAAMSGISIPEGQDASTLQPRCGTSEVQVKYGQASVSMAIEPVNAVVRVSVRSENTAYSGWNLESVSLTSRGVLPLAGSLQFDPSSHKAVFSGSTHPSVFTQIANPSALRTKPHSVSLFVYPSALKGTEVELSYTLSRGSERVSFVHALSFPKDLAAGRTTDVEDALPEEIDGDWRLEGGEIKYTSVFPGKNWETASPQSRGYSSSKFTALEKYIKDNLSTTSIMVAVGGKVIFSMGDLAENVRIASCRKSLLSTLYGKYTENGTIDLNASLEDLGIDEPADSWGGSLNWDGGALLPGERKATVKDLLTARSGVFHKPANSGDDHSYLSAADRGAHEHGTYFLYNNWDFNCAGAIFEQLTGKNIYEAFKEDIADRIGMEDYLLENQKKTVEYEGASRFPAYHFWISTRDMARMALLMLHKGDWNGNRVVSEEWASRITTTYTKREDMHPAYRLIREFGYGYLWWTFCPEYGGYDASVFEGGFTATGSGGQYITALPALDMVVAHKDKTSKMEKSEYYQLLKKIAACKE